MYPKKILNLLFPGCCVLCKKPTERNSDLCLACEKDLSFIENACPRCGMPFADNLPEISTDRCGACLKRTLPFDHALAVFHYAPPIDRLLIALKFKQKLLYAKILGELMAEKMAAYYASRQTKLELIIPIPLHAKRLRERGFNQALELAKPIAARLKIPLDKFSCLRIKNTAAQTLLTPKERRRNLKKAFLVKKPLGVKHVMVIDDVMTTGSTVREFCRTLRAAGVKRIDVWCCARVGGDIT